MTTRTVLDIINATKEFLAEKGFENARLETELLLSHVLDLSRVELYLDYGRQLSEGELARMRALLRRRLAGEPVQYVTGTAAFMFSEFEVNPSVLIPRPETEALTELALATLAEIAGSRAAGAGAPAPASPGLRVADVGTGSGVIAATIAQKVPGAAVYAIDSSAEALEVARRNAERVGVADRITFLRGRFLEPLRGDAVGGRLDAIVSNPPYVATGDIEALPAEVRDFEPREALDGGEDGLDCIRAIAQDGAAFLDARGALLLEFGDGQAAAVRELLEPGFEEVEIRKDYARRDRIALARRPGRARSEDRWTRSL